MAQFNMSPPVVAEAIATPIDVTIVEGVVNFFLSILLIISIDVQQQRIRNLWGIE